MKFYYVKLWMTPRFATMCIPEISCKWKNKYNDVIIIIMT